MKVKIGAVVAAVVAAASAAGAAAWAKRKRDEDPPDLEVAAVPGTATHPEGTKAAGVAKDGAAQGVTSAPDELTSLKGLGPKSAERLAEAGVTTLAEIAAWSDADIDEIAPRLKVSADRIRHEDWVGQARAATKG